MKIFVWQDAILGGGDCLVVAAMDLESALSVARNDPRFNKEYGDWLLKSEPEIVEIEYAKVVTHFSYYE